MSRSRSKSKSMSVAAEMRVTGTARKGVLLAALVLLWFGVLPGLGAEVVVFAAASLTDSLKEAGKVYQEKSKDKIVFNFAASSILARQIEEGAAADIFFSADEDKMNALEKKGLIQTRKSRLSNTLVIIVAQEGGAPVNKPQDL